MEEVRITKNVSGKTFNVDLISWDRRGNGVRFGKAFDVSKIEAKKEAQRVAKLYGAEIIDKVTDNAECNTLS